MDPNKNSNNNNKNNKNGKNNKNLKGLLTLVVWAVVLTVALNFLSAYAGNRSNKSTSHEVDYSHLWQLVEQGQITDVIFENDTIYATPRCGCTPYRLRRYRHGPSREWHRWCRSQKSHR